MTRNKKKEFLLKLIKEYNIILKDIESQQPTLQAAGLVPESGEDS